MAIRLGSPCPRAAPSTWPASRSRATLDAQGGKVTLFRLDALSKQRIGHVDRLPVSIKVLLEACLRSCDNFEVTENDVRLLADWNAKSPAMEELPFKPARVILQD